MSTENITTTAPREVVLEQIGAAVSKLRGAERAATQKLKRVERALRKVDPELEVWTDPLLHVQAVHHAAESTQPAWRNISIGFAPLPRLPQLQRWQKLARVRPFAERWGLVVREEWRADHSDRPLIEQNVSRLRHAPGELRVLAARHLDQLLQRLHEQVSARVEHLPPELIPSAPGKKSKAPKEAAAAGDATAQGAAPAPA